MPACVEDGCGAHLEISPTGKLKANAVIAALACNGISCVPGKGLFALEDEAAVQAGTVPAGGAGWGPVDLNAIGVGGFVVVASMAAVNTFTNESVCEYSNTIWAVTQREVLYTGPAGARFRVTVQENLAGYGFYPIIDLIFDYRFTFAGGGGGAISEAREGGSYTQGRLFFPNESLGYQYRIILTNLAPAQPGSLVRSAGLAFSWFSKSN